MTEERHWKQIESALKGYKRLASNFESLKKERQIAEAALVSLQRLRKPRLEGTDDNSSDGTTLRQ